MTTGDVNGKIEPNTAIELFGFSMLDMAITNARITGNITGNINCCASPRSSSTAEPIAANKDE